MFEPWLCTGGKHLAPATGGSCPCGMVTRILAPERPPAGPSPEHVAMLAQHLDEWSESLEAAASRLLGELEAAASRVLIELEAAASRLLREQADRVTTEHSTTGLVLSAGDADRLVAPRVEASQPAPPADTAPRAAAAREDVTPALESARATLHVGVGRAPGELDARPILGGGHDRADGHRRKGARKRAGQKNRQQPGRTKRPTRADWAILPPASRHDDRPMGPPGIFGEHDPEALREAV